MALSSKDRFSRFGSQGWDVLSVTGKKIAQALYHGRGAICTFFWVTVAEGPPGRFREWFFEEAEMQLEKGRSQKQYFW